LESSSVIVLIVDDHDDAREVLAMVLELAGHTVLQAANGVEAVDHATRLEPDLILMDLAMPVMDGLTATKLLRTQSKTAGIRIIALTANGDDLTWRNAALCSGCDECYTKPLNFGSLREMLSG
jgi:CheY-like chemotaxis protein